MTAAEWDAFSTELFVGAFAGQASDFWIWLRLSDCCPLDYDRASLTRLFSRWSRSRRRGKHREILNRRRREQFGPGRFHATTSAGVHLNRHFVKGWRGVNPSLP